MTQFQGIISRTVNNVDKQLDALINISTNVANINNWSYKSKRFEHYMKENGYLESTTRVDYSQGTLYKAEGELNIAIDGHGFIPVTGKDGEVSYTREGTLEINANGYICTRDGHVVGDGIKLPDHYERIQIFRDGTVSVFTDQETSYPTKIGKIPIVKFRNYEGLKELPKNKVVPTQESGPATLVTDHTSIRQGMLERSNVNMIDNINDTLRLNGSLIASTKLLKFCDEIYRQSINLKQ